MSNALVQAALTYPRRLAADPMLWFFLPLSAFGFTTACFDSDPRAPHALPAAGAMALGATVAFLTALIAGHAKGQFAAARARLTPGYPAAHAPPAIALTVTFVLLLPAVIAYARGFNVPGTLALTSCLAGYTWWLVLAQSPLLVWAGLGSWFALIGTPLGRAGLTTVAAAEHPALTYALLAAGLLSLALALLRTFTLHEDVPFYHRTSNRGKWWIRDGSMTAASPDVWKNWGWLYEPRERQLRRAAQTGPGLWSRARRLRISMAQNQALPAGVATFLICFALVGVLSVFNVFATPGTAGIWLAVIPFTFSTGIAAAHRALLPHACLRPVARRDLFKEYGLALAVNLVTLWASLSAGVLAAVYLAHPDRFDVGQALALLTISFCSQVYLFGVIVWMTRYRKDTKRVLGFAVGLTLPMILSVAAQDPRHAPLRTFALCAAPVLALLGLLIARDAYRRWLLTDLD